MPDVTDPTRTPSEAQSCSAGHGGLVWYELMTPDPQGAKAFYDSVVGWNLDIGGMGADSYHLIQRRDGGQAGGVLTLTEQMCEHGARPGWLGYIGVEDVDTVASAIEADGGKILMPAWDTPFGRITMVADPQGVPFYVMRPVPPEGQEGKRNDVFSVDRAQHFRWNELMTSDPDAAIAFYTRHFGWTQEGEMPMGEMGSYRFLQRAGIAIGAVMRKMAEMPVSMWNYYIGVDDIDRAVEAVKQGGGQLFMDPIEVPGGEFAANGTDPQGAAFAIVGPRNP